MDPITLGILGGTAAIGSLAKYFGGRRQIREANKINPVDPGANVALDANAGLLRDRYGNYMMPGRNAAVDNINRQASIGYGQARQAATSSGDVLDAASRIAFGTQSAMNDLAVQEALAKEQALADYLTANAQAGADRTAWGRQKYMMDMQNKTNLMNSGRANQMGALDSGLDTISQLATVFGNRKDG